MILSSEIPVFKRMRGMIRHAGASLKNIVFVILFVFAVPVSGFTIVPSGHLATSVKFNQSYFDFSRYNLHASGLIELAPNVHAEVGLDYQPSEPLAPIAWIDYSFLNAFRIEAGRFPIPFGAFNELLNPSTNNLVSTPEICTDAVPTPWLDWGARLQWMQTISKNETFSASFYICNGLGYGTDLRTSRQMTDNNNSNAVGARITLVSSKAGEFGASGYFGARDNADSLSLGLFGLDAFTKLWLIELRSEYVAGLLSFPKGAFDAIVVGVDHLADQQGDGYQSWTCGAYLEAAFKVSDFIVPAIRADILGYEDLNSKTYISRQRLSVGTACYPVDPLVLKFEFGIVNDKNEQGIKLEPLNLQLGVSF
ncbi:hypothetical protein GX441_12380 [bacterium]|nr:hypothetical protein [bacterium]